MDRREFNLLLLFSRAGIDPDMRPLSSAFWWRCEAIRQAIEHVHLWSPAQLCQSFGVPTGIRMVELLNREKSLQELLKSYAREGIRPLVNGQAEYPIRMAERLGKKSGCAPLVFFTCGNRALLKRPALGITGSRDPDEAMKRFAIQLADRCVQENLVLCEGGARGIDQTAEAAQLNEGGCCVCIPAVSLRDRLRHASVRQAVEQGRMLLLGSAPPEDPFMSYVALARNHCIAAQSGALVAIGPRLEVGGTWRCAWDNLKNGWTSQAYVYSGEGREELAGLGARKVQCPDQIDWCALRQDKT